MKLQVDDGGEDVMKLQVDVPEWTGAALLGRMSMSWKPANDAGGNVRLRLMKPDEIVDVWSVLSMQALLNASIDDSAALSGRYRVGNTMTDLALEPTVSLLIEQLAGEALSGARLWLCLDWFEDEFGLVATSGSLPYISVYFSKKANASPEPPIVAAGSAIRVAAEIAYPGSDPVLWVNKGRLLELLDTVDFVGGRPVGLGGKGASSSPPPASSGSAIFYGVAAAVVLGGLYWYSKRRGRLVPNALSRPSIPSMEDPRDDMFLTRR